MLISGQRTLLASWVFSLCLIFVYQVAAANPSSLPLSATATYRRKTATQWANSLKSSDCKDREAAASALYSMAIDHKAQSALRPLIAALKDSDKKVRRYAASALGYLGPDAAPALAKALKDSDWGVRVDACGALRHIGTKGTAAIPALIEALNDKNDVIWDYATDALALMNQNAKKQLMKAMLSRNGQVCALAAVALAKTGDNGNQKQALPVLIQSLDAPNAWVRTDCVLALKHIHGETGKIHAALLGCLKDPVANVRWRALQVIRDRRIAGKGDIPILIHAMRDKDTLICSTASETLSDIGAESVPALIGAIKDKNSHSREYAARALKKLGPKAATATPALIALLKDRHQTVRYQAVEALRAIGPQAREAVPALISILQTDKNAGMRNIAACALPDLGADAKTAVPALVGAFKKEKESVIRLNAIRAIGKLGPQDRKLIPIFIEALKDKDVFIQAASARALGKFGSAAKAAVPTLIEMLKNRMVRSEARYTLGRIGKDAVPALAKALDDPDENVRLSAISALSVIGAEAAPAIPALKHATEDNDVRTQNAARQALRTIRNELQEENQRHRDHGGKIAPSSQSLSLATS